MKKHIPNLITLFNLLSGSLGVLFVMDDNLVYGSYMIGLGLIFDFFDGFVARLLKVSSPVGKELDSLADVVTFGLLPSFIMYKLMLRAVDSGSCCGIIPTDLFPYIAFSIVAFSALRLANFNVDERQSDRFIGLPTPAASMVIGSLPLILLFHPSWSSVVLMPEVLLVMVIMLSYLLVAELPLLALKFKNFTWKDNIFRYLLILMSIFFVVTLHFLAFPCIIGGYIILSIVYNSMYKQ